ncbi:amidohydrolase family protein [Planosporangium thailandense]|uniref:Amidohydrolase family protein n=1 Tax=Planosporangium thailandense TaxID=765197 RepID=A0ABX0Y3A1_9ACTN|nr:amidohydrolase family protein [Planosporangium thailandense]NJC71907.1 amidohydrolase family protein [Planosporangium thailandense]
MELLICAGQALLGPAGQRIKDGAVLIRDDTIVAVGTEPEVLATAAPDVAVLSFPDGTVLPGLIDGHVHLAFDASSDPVGALHASSDTDLLLGMAGRARQLLDSGVTTVRDLGDRHGLAIQLGRAIESGTLPGPRVLAAGMPLTSPGGHCGFLGGEVDGEDAIRDLVRRNASAGAAVVKVMVTGGGLTKSGPPIWATQFSAAELAVVVEEARAAGLPVAAHAHGTDGIAAAVTAGVDTIEHCTWMADGGFDVREDLAIEMAAKGIRVCPAASPNWRRFAERFGTERAKVMFDRYRWLHDHGVGLLAGTDAGVPHAVFDNPVGSLEFFEYLGFSREHVIELTTVSTAEALGIAAETARLAAGYRADVLVVDGDPLTDLDALRQARLVVAGGRPHVPTRVAVRALSAS